MGDRRDSDHPAAGVRLSQQAAGARGEFERLHGRAAAAPQGEQLQLERGRRAAPVLHHETEARRSAPIDVGDDLLRIERVDRLAARARGDDHPPLVEQVEVEIVLGPLPGFVPVQRDDDARPAFEVEAVDRLARTPFMQRPGIT